MYRGGLRGVFRLWFCRRRGAPASPAGLVTGSAGAWFGAPDAAPTSDGAGVTLSGTSTAGATATSGTDGCALDDPADAVSSAITVSGLGSGLRLRTSFVLARTRAFAQASASASSTIVSATVAAVVRDFPRARLFVFVRATDFVALALRDDDFVFDFAFDFADVLVAAAFVPAFFPVVALALDLALALAAVPDFDFAFFERVFLVPVSALLK